MALVLSWIGVVGLIPWALGWSAAWLVWSSNPSRQNRRLALFLFLYTSYAVLQRVLRPWASSVEWASACMTVGSAVQFLAAWVYLTFLATLDTPMVRPLRPAWVQAGIGLVAATAALLVVLQHPAFAFGFVPFEHLATWSAVPPRNLWYNPNTWTLLAFLLGLVVAIDVRRRTTPGSLRRRKATAYLTAFAVNEALTILGVLSFYLWPGYAWYDGTRVGNLLTFVLEDVVITAYVVLLARAILRHQLFDIDVRIKRGVGRTVAFAAIAAAFFGVSELIEASLPVDGLVPGIAAAALVTLAFLPIQRAVTFALQRWFPSDQAQRKEEVYQAAFEEMGRDGRLTPAEQAELVRLRAKLGMAA